MFTKECVERLRARCVNGSLELGEDSEGGLDEHFGAE